MRLSWSSRQYFQADAAIYAIVASLFFFKFLIWLATGDFGVQATPGRKLFYETLQNDFFEYFLFNIEKPPVSIFLHAVLARIFGADTLTTYPVMVFTSGLLNIGSAVLIYASVRRVSTSSWIAATICVIYGMGLTSFEYWYAGSHYDHFTAILAAVYIYALSVFVTKPTLKSSLLLGCAGMVYALQSSVIVVVAPVIGLFAGISIWMFRETPLRPLVAFVMIAMALPIAGIGTVMAKNKIWSGVAVHASNGGAAQLMIVERMQEVYKKPVVDMAMDLANVPAWYRWCYKNPVSYIDPKTSQPHPGFDYIARTHGFCFALTDFEAPAWPTDFEPLLTHLKANSNPSQILDIVEQDAEISRNQRHLFSGYNPENTLNWVAAYGQISSKVFLRAVIRFPLDYYHVLDFNWKQYMSGGMKLPHTLIVSNRVIDAPAFVLIPLSGVAHLWGLTVLFGFYLSVAAAAASGISVLIYAWSAMFGKASNAVPKWFAPVARIGLVFAMPGIIIFTLYLLLNTSEWSRLFLHGVPFFFTVAAAISTIPSDART